MVTGGVEAASSSPLLLRKTPSTVFISTSIFTPNPVSTSRGQKQAWRPGPGFDHRGPGRHPGHGRRDRGQAGGPESSRSTIHGSRRRGRRTRQRAFHLVDQPGAPGGADPGSPGIEIKLRLELSLLADVGLLGLPNVGKSTLLSRVSAARPKIADYHLYHPDPDPGRGSGRGGGPSFTMADIPGLIEGAAQGAGLGTRFLKHVERCAVLLHIPRRRPNRSERTRSRLIMPSTLNSKHFPLNWPGKNRSWPSIKWTWTRPVKN